MIEILVARVFNTRNAVHIQHWKTTSYPQHVALGEFYDSLIPTIDSIVECYQGAVKKIDIPELPGLVQPRDIIKHLQEEVKWIIDNQKEICKELSAISNLVDNLTSHYFTTLYKLKNLQ